MPNLLVWKKLVFIVLLVPILLGNMAFISARADASTDIVVMIHGISLNNSGTNCNAHNTFGDMKQVLVQQGYSPSQLVTLGYYGNDPVQENASTIPSDQQTGCDNVINNMPYPMWNGLPACGNTDPSRFDNNTPIEILACYISWDLYNNYTQYGTHIQLVGHSMGGILIRYLLYKAGSTVQYYDSDHAYTLTLAPAPYVDDVVTLETPHGGVPGSLVSTFLCNNCLEGHELDLDDNNPFMHSMIADPASATPNGNGIAQWNMIGSYCYLDWTLSLSNCALEGLNTSTQIQGGNKFMFDCQPDTASSCYNHGGPLTDDSTVLDEKIDYCGNCAPEPSSWDTLYGEPHSLQLVADLLLHRPFN